MLFAFLGNPSGCCKLESGQREEEHVGSALLSSLPSWWGRGAPERPGRSPSNVDRGGERLASDSAGQLCLLACHNLSLQQGSAGSAAWRSDLWREGGPSERLKGEPLRLIRVTPAPSRKPAASTKKGQCACVQGGAGSHLMSSETQSGGTEPLVRPASSPAPLLSPAELLWASPVLEEVAPG